jgi:hypothetical protein
MAHITNSAAKRSKTLQLNLPTTIYKDPPKVNLPLDGMSRWNQIAPFSPFCREKFRQLVRAGKAPQPVRFSERCTAYPNRELHKFFADPLNYRAEVAA